MTDGPGRDPGHRYGPYETGARPQDAATRIEIERRQAAGHSDRSTGSVIEHDGTSDVKRIADDAKEAARDTAREAREAVEHRAERGKQALTGRADSFARALRQAGDALDDEGERDLARYGRDTADRVERFADYIDRRDIGGLLHDLQDTARSNPGAFLGTTFAAGLLLGRFLRAGTPEPEPLESRESVPAPRYDDTSDLATPTPEYGYEASDHIYPDPLTSRPGRDMGTTERQDLR